TETPKMSNDVQETLKRLSTTFTVKGIMTPGPQLVCACNTEQAVTVSAGYPDFSVIPIRENGMITGFFQRDSHTTNKITVDNLISDGTNLLDLVDIFQQRDFSFVLSHQHIDGYVHYSDLNHQLVKWTFYVMLEAVERVALESIRPADERRYVAGKLGQERFEQIDRQYKRAGDNARSFLTYLNTADILRLAVKEGSIELEDITIR